MTSKASQFWRDLAIVQSDAAPTDRDHALERLREFARSEKSPGRLRVLDQTLRALKVETAPCPADAGGPQDLLGPIAPTGEDGISVVTCAMNRTENLLAALRTWLAFSEVSEIVIVDWSSEVPVAGSLREAGLDDPRIRILRVEGEPRWILSYAFNVGFRAARFDKVLKVDADLLLMPDFFACNPLPERSFVAGNWRKAQPGQAHVNGFFFVTRDVLSEVAGFNEFITTYGWDDDDLYQRLTEIGATRIDVAADTIYHQEHSDAARIGTEAAPPATVLEEITGGTMFCIRRNRFLANVMPLWNADRLFLPFHVLDVQGRETTLRRTGDVPHPVPEQIWADAHHYALAEMASWRFGAPILSVPRAALPALLDRPAAALDPDVVAAAAQAPAAPYIAPGRARFFIDAQHGLGNKLRAIGSAAAIAEATDRELVIVWQPDHHCEGSMTDLFDYDGAVIEESFPGAAPALGARLYNYMEIEAGAEKDAPIDLGWSGDIYARSAYVLKAAPSRWETENRFLQSLTPAAAVRDLVASVRRPNDVSAHVRMVGAPGTDTASYDRAENWTAEGHAAINHWREKSHYSHFIKRLDALIAEGVAERIFVAADMPETYDAFAATFGDRVAYLKPDIYDRSREQLFYALADAILLGSAPRLLGSNWSSFTELATRLSPGKVALEMSGKDF